MKTAEEWATEFCGSREDFGEDVFDQTVNEYKQIQLDAYKASMRDAAVIGLNALYQNGRGPEGRMVRDAILKARDAKTTI